MEIIVGIGNPGTEYASTRHNVGFMVLDRLAKEHGVGPWKHRFHALAAEGNVSGKRLLLLKPQTFMNDSGRAVRAAVDWLHSETKDVLVVCDDFNLTLGRMRIRPGGSSAGHHGLDSITATLGTQDFPRLRVGIGNEKGGKGKDFVLSTFSAAEKSLIEESVARVARAVEVWLQYGMERCQNEFNVKQDANKELQEEDDA